MSITIKNGDILDSTCEIILQQVNCKGVMGAGLAKAIREKYPQVYTEYKKVCDHFKEHQTLLLGHILQVQVKPDQHIINVFGQTGYGYAGQYTQYGALEDAFLRISLAKPEDTTIAIPYKMGCGLGGGDWNRVYSLIEKYFSKYEVTIYKKN